MDDFRYDAVLMEEGARAGLVPAATGPVIVADLVLPNTAGLGTGEQQARWLLDIVRHGWAVTSTWSSSP